MWGMGRRKRPARSQDESAHATSEEIGSSRKGHSNVAGRSRLVRGGVLLAAVVVAVFAALLVVSSSDSALSGTALPASVGLNGWDTVSGSWTPGNTVQYSEKQAIPFRLDLGGLSTSSTYLVNVCREFQNGTKYGFLFLDEYNKTVALSSAQAGGTVVDATGPFATINATVTGVQDYTDAGGICGTGERLVQVTVQPTDATTSYLLWGGHLAAPGDTVPGTANLVGFGNGAGSYPGSSLAMRLVSPDKTVPIPVNKIVTLTKVDVNKLIAAGSGGTAVPGDFCFTISPNPNGAPQVCGSGSFLDLPSGTYTVQEAGPAGYTLQSVTGTLCSATAQQLAAGQASAGPVVATTGAPTTASCTFTNIFQKQTPTLATTSSPTGGSVVPGTSVSDSFTASGGFGTPGGTVDFFLCQPAQVTAGGCEGSAGTKIGATKPLLAGAAASDSTANTTTVGKYCWRAVYSGDNTYNGGSHTNSTSECFTTVKQASTTATTSSPTGGSVVPGTSVSDSATVSGGAGQPTPTGTVDFFLCQPAQVTAGGCEGSAGTKIGATKPLVAGAAASDSTANTTTVGKYCWRAEYSGDSFYNSSSHTNAASECFTVVSQPAILGTTSSTQSATVVPGTSVSDSFTASGGFGTPGGTVDFFLCQPAQVTAGGCEGSAGTKIGATKPLVAGAAASDSTANTTAIGKYCWRAVFTADAPYSDGEHTNSTSECFTTVKQASTTATTSSPTGGSVVPGTSVSDSATVSGGAGQPTPTGTVDFFLCQPAQVTAGGCEGSAGTKIGATKPLVAGAAASDSTANTTTVGKYCWRAEYSGDSFYNSSSHTNCRIGVLHDREAGFDDCDDVVADGRFGCAWDVGV